MVVLVAVLVGAIAAAATSVPADRDGAAGPDGTAAAPADATESLQHLHEAGVTGAGVRVGVVDVTGFDPDHPALDGRVAAARSFAAGEDVRNGGRNDHGTAAASLVARTAPGAELYLATFDTADGFRRAVDWLLDGDVDVVVAPVAFYGTPGDGSSDVARAAARAADRGVVFVAPAGNLGRGHWQGEFAPATDGSHRFDGGPRNYLHGDAERRLTLWLSWERQARGADMDLELYRTDGESTRLVARSQPYPGDGVPNERIVARVDPRETYYFVVRGPESAAGTRIEVSSPTHAFQVRDRTGSLVAPATAPAVVAVGAYDERTGRVEPFSSAGPTSDGRTGVDVVAPDRLQAATAPGGLVGSSAAAPYVAGVAALVLDADPGLAPDRVGPLLRETATDVDAPGVDPVAGHGRIAPRRAVERVANGTVQSGV